MTENNFIHDMYNRVVRVLQKHPETPILPSVITCQAVQETGYGKLSLLTKYNNYFGLVYMPGDKVCEDLRKKYDVITVGTFEIINGKRIDCDRPFYIFHTIEDGIEALFYWYIKRTKYKNLIGCVDFDSCLAAINKKYATDPNYCSSLKKIYNKWIFLENTDKAVVNSSKRYYKWKI